MIDEGIAKDIGKAKATAHIVALTEKEVKEAV